MGEGGLYVCAYVLARGEGSALWVHACVHACVFVCACVRVCVLFLRVYACMLAMAVRTCIVVTCFQPSYEDTREAAATAIYIYSQGEANRVRVGMPKIDE